jgi:hypothetical protein
MRSRALRAIRLAVLLALTGTSVSACQRRAASITASDPGGSYQIEWVSVAAPSTLKPGQQTSIAVSFRNAGKSEIAEKALAISYHWMDGADPERVIVWDGLRAAVGRTVRPGETHSAQLPVRSPDRPGNYILNVDLVREGVAWFSGRGSPMSSHPVTVQ